MEFSNVVENVEKLMKFRRLGITELSEKSGISEVGLRKMFKTGAFKLESLSKIAQGLEIPMIVLLAKKIIIKPTLNIDDDGMFHNYNILWTGGSSSQSLDGNKNALVNKLKINTEYYSETREVTDDLLVEGDEKIIFSFKERIKTIENELLKQSTEINTIVKQLKDKEEILEFVRRENMFAFANVIGLLMQNKQGNDTGIAPEKLNDITRSKIFDESFLKTLLDNGLIRESDYQFFISAKNAPGTP